MVTIMNKVITYHKKRFETPLQMLDRLRTEQPEIQDETLSYLGRLDPLAHGVMRVAVGDANKDRARYLNCAKTYRVSFLFGMSTDTGDVLGCITDKTLITRHDVSRAQHAVTTLDGMYTLPYPNFSSKTYKGTPLHVYARQGGRVPHILREMHVIRNVSLGTQWLSCVEVGQHALDATVHVSGDFRQELVADIWRMHIQEHGADMYPLVNVELTVSSGTYIRALAAYMALQTRIPCLAYDIERLAYEGF